MSRDTVCQIWSTLHRNNYAFFWRFACFGMVSHRMVLSTFFKITWWRHQMETFPALLAICAGKSPVTGEVPAQRPVTRTFDVFFDLRLNKRLSKQSWGWWFETPPRSLWHHCNASHALGQSYDAVIPFRVASIALVSHIVLGCRPDEPLASLVTTNRIMCLWFPSCYNITHVLCPSLFVFCWVNKITTSVLMPLK